MATRPLNIASLFRTPALHTPQRAAAKLLHMVRAFQTRRELARLDARMLRDIGLTSGDAAREAARAPWDLR